MPGRPHPKSRRRSKKKLAEAVADEAAAHPGKPVEAWAFDEHRVGLKPVLRRIRAPKGQRPRAAGHHRFRWLYLYAFVEPHRGEVAWFLFNTVNVEAFEAALASFARTVGAGEARIVVLVLDNAGWHVPPDLAVPGGVRLVFLPPYTPELQPAERLWPLTNGAIANTSFATLGDLDAALAARCCQLADQPAIISGQTAFHWWPKPLPTN